MPSCAAGEGKANARVAPGPRVMRPVTEALESFAEELRKAGINPDLIAVSIPLDEWRKLARMLEQERGEPVGANIGQIEIAGVKYLVRFRP